MIGKTSWLLQRLFSQIWVRAVSFAVLGVDKARVAAAQGSVSGSSRISPG
ncbi:MAG: hypothetical protein ACNA8G_10615 [Gammaproteobacteria bacterium]